MAVLRALILYDHATNPEQIPLRRDCTRKEIMNTREAPDSRPTDEQNRKAATRVTLIGSVLDLVLGIFKIVIGLSAHSIALVSDGIHSLSDLLTDAFVLLVTAFSHAKPDRKHPYGHRRFETLGTIILGIVLFAVAGIICYDSVRRIAVLDPLPVPQWPGLLIAMISIASKEWIYRYTRKVAEEINSSLILANAWHSRSDAFSSIAVLIGILGAMAGFPVMDQLAAVVVALMIGKIAWDLIGSSLSELVDTALPVDQVNAIRQHARALEGVRGVHDLRTRSHAGRVFLDLHIQVDERISVSEGHFLADRLNQSLKKHFPDISDIIVHVDPEPDNDPTAASQHLPLRQEIEATLTRQWQQHLPERAIKRLELHYLADHVDVDIYLDISILNNDLRDLLEKESSAVGWLGRLTFYGMP